MNIEQYFFPVEEHDITLHPTPWQAQSIKDYKAIVAPSPNGTMNVISVVRNSYKLVENKALIEPFLEEVSKLGTRWKIDRSHSFCQLNRMRLQVTFPDISIRDEDSEIPLSIFLHNSYDQSEGVRLFWGGIRSICTNGMVFGTILGSFYARHTQGFNFAGVEKQFDNAALKINEVKLRLKDLDSMPVDEQLMKVLQKKLGKRRLEDIVKTDTVPDISQWDLLNDITYYISHDVAKPKRADLQNKVSEVFAL